MGVSGFTEYLPRTLSFPYQFPLGTCLTIRADIKCENLTNGYITIVYGDDFEDSFNFGGDGTTTVIFNSELPSDDYHAVEIRRLKPPIMENILVNDPVLKQIQLISPATIWF